MLIAAVVPSQYGKPIRTGGARTLLLAPQMLRRHRGRKNVPK